MNNDNIIKIYYMQSYLAFHLKKYFYKLKSWFFNHVMIILPIKTLLVFVQMSTDKIKFIVYDMIYYEFYNMEFCLLSLSCFFNFFNLWLFLVLLNNQNIVTFFKGDKEKLVGMIVVSKSGGAELEFSLK